MYHYAFTVRNLSNSKPEDYPPVISAFKKKYPHVDVRFHYEVKFKKNGHHNIHIHGVMQSPKKLSYRQIASCCPFKPHVYLDFIKSLGWKVYITKEKLDTIQDVNNLLTAYSNGDCRTFTEESSEGYHSDGRVDPLERTITYNLFRNI